MYSVWYYPLYFGIPASGPEKRGVLKKASICNNIVKFGKRIKRTRQRRARGSSRIYSKVWFAQTRTIAHNVIDLFQINIQKVRKKEKKHGKHLLFVVYYIRYRYKK
jgi:hypothetical protein